MDFLLVFAALRLGVKNQHRDASEIRFLQVFDGFPRVGFRFDQHRLQKRAEKILDRAFGAFFDREFVG